MEKISDYRQWDQLEHAEEYLLYPENLGHDMSLDETCLSNGDVYTILTNKAAHGGKGALAAMVRGVATDAVSAVLKKIPLRKRLEVKTVTTDLSSAMMLTVRTVFPAASLINDRFHVQQLLSEAVDQLRVRHRWEVLDKENRAIREYRAKRNSAKTREERDRIGKMGAIEDKNGAFVEKRKKKSKGGGELTVMRRIVALRHHRNQSSTYANKHKTKKKFSRKRFISRKRVWIFSTRESGRLRQENADFLGNIL